MSFGRRSLLQQVLEEARYRGLMVQELEGGWSITRPENYAKLSQSDQWEIDKYLGILDRPIGDKT